MIGALIANILINDLFGTIDNQYAIERVIGFSAESFHAVQKIYIKYLLKLP